MNLTFKSIAFFKPWIDALYSTTFVLHWNSSLQANMDFLPLVSRKMQPAPTPSLDFDPWKNKVQKSLFSIAYKLSEEKSMHLEKSVWETFTTFDCADESVNG